MRLWRYGVFFLSCSIAPPGSPQHDKPPPGEDQRAANPTCWVKRAREVDYTPPLPSFPFPLPGVVWRSTDKFVGEVKASSLCGPESNSGGWRGLHSAKENPIIGRGWWSMVSVCYLTRGLGADGPCWRDLQHSPAPQCERAKRVQRGELAGVEFSGLSWY